MAILRNTTPMTLRLTLLLTFLLAPAVRAQEEDPASVQHAKIASAKAEPATVKPGETFTLVFKLQMMPEWHIYSANGTYSPTEWAFAPGTPLERAGSIDESKPRHHRVSLGKDDDGKEEFLEYDYHEVEATFRVPVKLAADAKPGTLKIAGKVTGQECDPKVCIPFDLDFSTEITVVGATAAAPVPGQDEDPAATEHTRILSTAVEPANPKVGETFHLVFKIRIAPKWHIYSPNGTYSPTVWEFKGLPLERVGKVDEPKPQHHHEVLGPGIIEDYDFHEGDITFRVPVRLTGEAKPGPLKIAGAMVGQECDPNVCVPFNLAFGADITVVEGGVAVDTEYEQHGFFGLVLLGILGGLVSLIMPCTYPLIPITLTYFVKQAHGSRRHGLVLSSVYSLGIILSFTGLGFVLTLLMGAGGAREFAADPWVNIVVALLFLWFTGSLFGWYEIKLPFGLGEKLVSSQRSGAGGAFILGLLFSIVTFTCTIPIAGTILTIAAGQHRFAALMAMLFYSITMALPFFLMGLFPATIREIPRSGGWLQTTKITMAWVELALAGFYLSKADQTWEVGFLNRPVMLVLWIAVSLVVAAYLLGLLKIRPSVARVGFALVFLVFGGYMAYGFSGKPLGLLEIIVPPPPFQGTTLPEALEEAKKINKPVFAEFTGVT